MKTTHNTGTKDLRDELVNIYFSKILLKGYPRNKTRVSKSLIRNIIEGKAKRVAFPPYRLPISLKGKGTTAISNLCQDIYDFYNTKPLVSQADFDKWFNQVANNFISATGGSTSFGNAQKIINITLKHLYAYTSKKKIENFKYCHFTLDDITYGGFYKYHLNKGTSFYKKEINTTKLTKKWTTINEEEYYSIQEEIREYFYSRRRCFYQDGIGQNLTPFEAEIVIWTEYKK